MPDTKTAATPGSSLRDSNGPAFEELDRPRPLPHRVADEILKKILADGLQPDDQLPTERQLAAQFGVSRTVIREGVRTLAGKGIVEVSTGRGIRVARVGISAVQESIGLFLHSRPMSDYRKLHEFRVTIEVEIAGLAAQRRKEDDLGSLHASVEEMASVIDDPEAASIEDLQFHRQIARCTDNEFYLVALDALVTPLLQIRRTTFGPGGRTHEALSEHRAILGCISNHDSAGARDQMRRHLGDIEKAWERQRGSGLEA